MKIRTILLALLASVALVSAGRTMAAPAAQPATTPRYVYFTLYSNLIARLAPRQELLEVRLDLDLKQVPLREALRQIFGQAKQEYSIADNVAEVQRITLQGKGLMLSEALDGLIQQVRGSWTQELKDGKPLIRIHGEGSPMTIHLPATPDLLEEVARLRQERPAREPTSEEIRQMAPGHVVASGRAHNTLGRRGLPFVTIP
jgi:hypothetical protein